MDLNPELKIYLAKKKWKYRPASDNNIAVQVCPFCGKDKWKFWVHSQRTLYKCWVCDARGNLYRLKRELGDLDQLVSAAHLTDGDSKKKNFKPIPMDRVEKWHAKLKASKDAMEYCKKRGFNIKTINQFKLGLQKHGGKYWLAIPHIANNICRNVKFRSMPPSEKAFRRVGGAQSVLFNEDALATYDSIVIAESETDAMSFWQAGVKNIIGLTGGAETFLPEWYDLLSDKEEITICLDADSVGQSGARSLARRLGFDRCKNVLLPSHDANELLVHGGPQELAASIKQGEKFEVAGILTAADVMLQCREDVSTGEGGLLTPWPSMNRLLGGGWNYGDLVVMSAKVKVGKTTLALNIALHQAMHGIPSMVYCLEMQPRRLAEKVACILRKKVREDLTDVDFAMARYMLRSIPLYFVEPEWGGELKRENVVNKIRESVKRYGIKLLVFDHLHFLCRSLQYMTNEIGQITRDFKLMTEELEIVTILIAQPKKLQTTRVMTYDDIKDSSAIPADADQVVILHRNPIPAGLSGELSNSSDQEVLESKTLVRIDAARFRGGGETYLDYDGATATFSDRDKKGE